MLRFPSSAFLQPAAPGTHRTLPTVDGLSLPAHARGRQPTAVAHTSQLPDDREGVRRDPCVSLCLLSVSLLSDCTLHLSHYLRCFTSQCSTACSPSVFEAAGQTPPRWAPVSPQSPGVRPSALAVTSSTAACTPSPPRAASAPASRHE